MNKKQTSKIFFPEPEMERKVFKKQKPPDLKKIIIPVTTLLVAAIVIIILIVIKVGSTAKDGEVAGDMISQEEILKEVSSVFSVPDEKPVIATVTNLDKLSGQEFFKNAQVDDKVIFYEQSSKVVLYRPSQKRIIEVGRISDQQKIKK